MVYGERREPADILRDHGGLVKRSSWDGDCMGEIGRARAFAVEL